MNILDEFSREFLVIKVDRKLNSMNVIDALTDLFIMRGPPAFIRSDSAPEFIAQTVRNWITAVAQRRLLSNQAALGNVEDGENSVGHCFPDTWIL